VDGQATGDEGHNALVGARDEELVDEVALAARHLDAVVAGASRASFAQRTKAWIWRLMPRAVSSRDVKGA
jgi:hypothetical protein